MERGWVYVLVNSSIPGMVKVGRTTNPPAERAAQLSAATGVVTPFVLAFEQSFADCVQAEQDIHAVLDSRGMRVAANREFFSGSAAEIVRVVLEVADAAGGGPGVKPAPSAAEMLAEGDRYLFGVGDTFEDVTEALRCYRLAAGRGSLVALERQGAIYAQLHGRSRADRRRAMKYLKEGAARGNYYCFCEMAMLYLGDPHKGNFAKAWDRYFSERAANPCAEVEEGAARYLTALRRYVCACIDLSMPPAHKAELLESAMPLLREMARLQASMSDSPQARLRLTGAMRWTVENLLPAPHTAEVTRGWSTWRWPRTA